jgi:hypothetical protein
MANQAEALEIHMEFGDIPGTSLKASSVAIGTWPLAA